MKAVELDRFVCPESVAVVGASKTPESIGNNTIKDLRGLNYKGKVFAVNPRYEEVEGYPCYPNITAIPDAIDVAIIAVAARFVKAAIQDCADKGVKFVLIFSSGFGEKGEEGLKEQNDLLNLCRKSGVRAVGPNSMGIYNFVDNIKLAFSENMKCPRNPEIGIVSQSGAIGRVLTTIAMAEKIGISYMLTAGNQMDINTIDFVDFLVKQPDTKQILAYFEGIPDGDKLKQVAINALEKHKPIMALQPGLSEAGKRVARNHTGSVIGSRAVFELVADRYGITLVSEFEELIDTAKAFKTGKRLKGNRAAMIVISGGAAIVWADELTKAGFEIPELSEATVSRLAEVVPSYCYLNNPVDIATTLLVNPILLNHCVDTLANSGEVDIIFVQLMFGPDQGGLKAAQDILDVAKDSDKLILVTITASDTEVSDIRAFLNDNDIPAYTSLKAAVKSARNLLDYEKKYMNLKKLTSEGAQNYEADGKFVLPSSEERVGQLLEQLPVKKTVEGPVLEAAVKVVRDPIFGPVISCDLDGVYSKTMKDISQSVAPISPQLALNMIKALNSYPLLSGRNNGFAYDIDAFATLLSSISQAALSWGELWTDFEINPLKVGKKGQGVAAREDGIFFK